MTGQCPFPFADKYELWLLDSKTHEPLALLDSICKKTETNKAANLTWEAGLRCKQEFMKDFSLPGKQAIDERAKTAADFLNQIINQRAGENPSAQWFYRNSFSYGEGLTGINLPPTLIGHELSARLFPKMLVHQNWQDETKDSLIEAFIHWLSPYLLVLDFLRDKQREELELIAKNHALLVDQMFPL